MNRPLSWLIVVGLAVGICACDKKDGVPMPKTGTGEVKRQAKEAVGAAEKRFHNDSFFASLRRAG